MFVDAPADSFDSLCHSRLELGARVLEELEYRMGSGHGKRMADERSRKEGYTHFGKRLISILPHASI